MEILENKSISCVKGFRVASIHAGFKRNEKLDMGLIVSDVPAVSAAVFTTNLVKAAPVQLDMKHIKNDTTRALIINAGNANACTGQQGLDDARSESERVAKALGVKPEEVLVYSTGVIGQPLPMDKVNAGIDKCLDSLRDDGDELYKAIMTTDTREKRIYLRMQLSGKDVDICGIAKGSGMIHPNMGTMLSYVVTDCNITKEMLTRIQKDVTAGTFNMVTVDGDTSTNDTATIVANGLAGNTLIDRTDTKDYECFCEAVYYVTEYLAKAIAADGEGASRFMEVYVYGADELEQARTLARSVAGSSLFKAALHGADANWGRIVCAMGYSGARFDQNKVDVGFESKAGEIEVFTKGVPLQFDEDLATKILSEDRVQVKINLNSGEAQAKAWGCDLTAEYVKINGDYRS
ncbi:MAG: bifunctional glutamate N-acetyltransferase/amino-acid acetyltransferase ArgJ [Anaerovoracaceae bacterium]|nr:bifunctional glutamate N-acetyltransferase/amino-acid acetyltransferase ArgJ [Bacillota bacterium]MDY2671088.1 bifunctional glutamate N-acetyltransferase/amino-acid acetyltransferase ArgJ [Anaerovoracaceae bacterium]